MFSFDREEEHVATIVEPPVRPAETEQRFMLYNVGWDGYEAMLKLVGDRPIRLTYDRGNLELLSPSKKHERSKSVLGRMVETITEELEIPCISAGSTTWRREDLDRGLEPDEGFHLFAHAEQVYARESNPAVDPPPNLAIEVEITSSALDRLGIYAALGVPEVWRYDGQALRVLALQPDGTYAVGEASFQFPFLP
ncbi:MAG TPA: Uma2 family endonuclease, partial [Isosphaeraceae bacterium]